MCNRTFLYWREEKTGGEPGWVVTGDDAASAAEKIPEVGHFTVNGAGTETQHKLPRVRFSGPRCGPKTPATASERGSNGPGAVAASRAFSTVQTIPRLTLTARPLDPDIPKSATFPLRRTVNRVSSGYYHKNGHDRKRLSPVIKSFLPSHHPIIRA